MNKPDPYIDEERLSVMQLIQRVRAYIAYLWERKMRIIALAGIISLFYFSYNQFRKPVYTAETTFVLESGSGSSGAISSLASVVGVNFNQLGDGSSLFEEDNIIELYRSRKMLYETFLSRTAFGGESVRLITRFGQYTKKLKKWKRSVEDQAFSFEVPDSLLTVKHDSILFEVILDFKKDNLIVEKPDRLLSILSVKVISKDQPFAKAFNEILVEKVNKFYLTAKTKKTGENVEILSFQSDSVKRVLDESLAALARVTEETPNPNPLYVSNKVPIQKLTIEVQANAAVYQEMVKNLEIARIEHRNSTPLIQIIDEPMYPLTDDKDSLVKRIAISIILGGFLSVLYFSLLNFWLYIKAHY